MVTVYYRTAHSLRARTTGVREPTLELAWAAWRTLAGSVDWHTAWVRPL
jgi:hypothetical protein